MRVNYLGIDVTNFPNAWRESDYEIVATNYRHPTISSGRLTGGAATFWVRRYDSKVWWDTKLADKQKVISMITALGKLYEKSFDEFGNPPKED